MSKKQFLAAVILGVPMVLTGAALMVSAAPVGDGAAPPVSFHRVEGQEPTYEGSRSGCRTCHLSEYRSWERTPHADALETLPEESRQDSECLRCHTTGFGAPTGFASVADTPQLAGVGCEVCHGPGSLYKDRETMGSRDASVAAGLTLPDESTCRQCHNEQSPTFPGDFDFEEMRARGVHDIG